MMKRSVLICCLLILRTAIAQETEFERPPAPPVKEAFEESAPPEPELVPPPRMITDPDSVIVDFPDVPARYPGGTDALKKFVRDNLQYPVEDLEDNVQGRVYVVFIVEPDGSLSNIHCMRGGVSPTLNREAERVIGSMPLWIPAENEGEKVRTRCRYPVKFTLLSDEDEKKEATPMKKRRNRKKG